MKKRWLRIILGSMLLILFDIQPGFTQPSKEVKALGRKDLSYHAQALELDLPMFEQCLDSGRQAAEIRKDVTDGLKAGVRGTPTFFLGFTEANDPKVRVLRVIRGAQPYGVFKEAIESLLQ